MSMEEVMDAYRLPDSEIFALKPSDKVIRHKTLKVKREADKVKAVYSLGSGYQAKVVADLLGVQLHYTGKESSLTNEQEQELAKHLDENLYIGAG